ncbi:MAG: DUF368 domain-containing protein [Lentimicrobiaceae bacterium]|jgi:putative membrane protein|nr:DUF368 domain-containing protein [Lentimicrobiaceae bacterium]
MKSYILTFLKGIAMGAADVVPGVSGGTIAFITGIYERLLDAIKSVNLSNMKLFFKGKFKAFWRNIDGAFLLSLLSGIALSLFTLAHLMTYLLDHYPILLWSFFFGLILASTVFVGKDVRWNWKTILFFLLFTIVAFFVTSPTNVPLNSENSYWYLFLCGAIAICAMILPGISGSFILVLLGQYYFVLEAVKELNIVVILVFGTGALIGILAFSNILSWLFKHFKMLTLASLTGFMFGSLNKIWPWKETVLTYSNSDGIIKPLTEKNISPIQFEALTNQDNQLFWAIFLMIIGFSIIFVIEFIASKTHKEKA